MAGITKWFTHQNKEMLLNDRSGLRDQDIITNVKNAVKLIKECGKTDILYLVDNSNTIIVPEVKDYIKQAGKELKPFLKKTAVVGTNNAQKILINVLATATGMSIRVFNDLESAKDWLAK